MRRARRPAASRCLTVMLAGAGSRDVAMSDGRSVGSQEAAAGHQADVGDVLADAAEPAAVAFACACPLCGGDRFDEVAQTFAGVRESAAVALVLLGHAASNLYGDRP